MGTVHYISSSGGSGSTSSKADTKTLWFPVIPETKSTMSEQSKASYGSTTTAGETDDLNKNDYEINFQNMDIVNNLSIHDIVKKLNRTVGIVDSSEMTYESIFSRYHGHYYNRFKLPVADNKLNKGFGHVFFVRPDCNVFSGGSLTDQVKNNATYAHIFKNSPSTVKELVLNNGVSDNDFSMALSNAATNFPLSDEFIETDNYGKTWTGYKVAFGRHNIDSKTAGDIQINFRDDRNLHIYKIHKLWVEYISNCYRGELYPRDDYLIDKILDYAGAIYYIMTAEDGETILFWSKYYGVFPITIPSDPFTWAEANVINNPELQITYKYSFKEDYNPLALVEFNKNARVENMSTAEYVPIYDSKLGHAADTWVGTPFIDEVNEGGSLVYKLRFLRADDSAYSTNKYYKEVTKTTYNSGNTIDIDKISTYPTTAQDYANAKKKAEYQTKVNKAMKAKNPTDAQIKLVQNYYNNLIKDKNKKTAAKARTDLKAYNAKIQKLKAKSGSKSGSGKGKKKKK